MEAQKPQFNRILLIILIVLFVLTIAGLIYLELAASAGEAQWWMILLNIPILAMPLGLVFGSIYILVAGWREYTALGQVSPRMAKVIHWAPRIAAILIIFFISLFSLDVFGMGGTPLELLGGFIMHNIPAIVMLLVLILAWKRPVLGFVVFLAAAVAFSFFFVRSIYSPQNLILFVFPILLIAFLFFADWKWLKPKHPVQSSTTV